jgi:hypothetical protein
MRPGEDQQRTERRKEQISRENEQNRKQPHGTETTKARSKLIISQWLGR